MKKNKMKQKTMVWKKIQCHALFGRGRNNVYALNAFNTFLDKLKLSLPTLLFTRIKWDAQ